MNKKQTRAVFPIDEGTSIEEWDRRRWARSLDRLEKALGPLIRGKAFEQSDKLRKVK